jgi:hypothetical protein
MWLHCISLISETISSLNTSRIMREILMHNDKSDQQKTTTTHEHIVPMSVACIILVKMRQP